MPDKPRRAPPAPARTAASTRARRWLRRLTGVAVAAAGVVGAYTVFVLVGLVPVNNGFRPDPDGVEIQIVSTAVHADVVLPLVNDVFDWRARFPAGSFARDTSRATHVAIGWGERGFYLETPAWADLKVSTAARALLVPSRSCMHVTLLRGAYTGDGARRISISRQQYAALVDFVVASFRRDADDRFVPIEGFAYGANDAFFEAHGSYHLVNTCNSWAGRALRSAGVRTPWLTPLPKTVYLYLPD